EGITSLSNKPIRFVTYAGILAALLGLAMGIYTLVSWATGHTVAGWASIMMSIWLLGGLARPWGVLNATRLLVLGFGVLSVAAAILYGERSRRRWIEAGACLVLALAAGFFSYRTTAAATLQSAGVFPRLICRDSGFARGKAEWEKRTQDHTFSFFADKDYGFVLAQDGCPRILKNRFHTVRTVSGYLPLLLNPDARRVAVLGDNAGYVIPFILRGGIHLAVTW
ncbi:MAG: hypothetical protein IJQ00_14105, partial [Kiritimatiellae bacterium]|nr:hypothetical protein [Kiritimatiellia bacterium]